MRNPESYLVSLYMRHPFLRPLRWILAGALCAATAIIILFSTSSVETLPVGWERSFYVSPPYITAKNPRLVSRGNIVAAVYQGREGGKGEGQHYIYSSISFNGGASYIAPIKIAPVSGTIEHNPYAAISPRGHVAVAWQNIVGPRANSRLFYSVSKDTGATWGAPAEVGLIRDSDTETDMDMLPQVYYDDLNRLHLFYHALRGNSFNLFHSVSADGSVFDVPRRLVDMPEGLRGAFFPAILFSGNAVYLVWQGRKLAETRFSDDLFFMRSNNYGNSWSRSRKITDGRGSSASPSIEVRGSTVYVAYQNNREKTWGIYLSMGRNGGADWEGPPLKVSDTNANCYSPSVLQSVNEELMLIWYDLRFREPSLQARKLGLEDMKLSDVMTVSRNSINPVATSVDRKAVVLWREGARIKANFSDVYVAPPFVTSLTHPSNMWSRAPGALIEITPPKDEAGIKFYSIVVNQDPNDNPPDVETLSGRLTRYQTPLLDDGVHYVHVRAIDNAGNVSRTVHYKLQISRSPLQVSDLKSPTHKEGTPEVSNAPGFNWDMNTQDLLRTKGFLVGLTRDKIAEPVTFTTDFSADFRDLGEGRYFFSIRAVDKTNKPGALSSYEIIVGQAEALDLEYIKRVAREMNKERPDTTVVKRRAVPRAPAFVLNFPFDTDRSYGGGSFDVFISPRNIREQNVAGYSVVLDKKKTMPGDAVNLRSNVISIKDLKDGTYYLAYKGKYHKTVRGKKVYYWTDPVVRTFTIETPLEPSPVIAYSETVTRRLAERWLLISLSMAGLVLTIAFVGFGGRVAFYANYLAYRMERVLKKRGPR